MAYKAAGGRSEHELRSAINGRNRVLYIFRTSGGVTLYFNGRPPVVGKDPGRVEVSLSGQMKELKSGFGGRLIMEGGSVKSLEFFAFGEPWPETPTNVKMSLG